MLSLQKCRNILGPSCTLSDSELEQTLEALYALADISFQSFQDSRKIAKQKAVTFEEMLELLSESEKDDVLERSGIMEFEGKASRDFAERAAIAKYFQKNGKKN